MHGRELGLDAEGSSFWWSNGNSVEKGLSEIKTNLDALSIAMSMGVY